MSALQEGNKRMHKNRWFFCNMSALRKKNIGEENGNEYERKNR